MQTTFLSAGCAIRLDVSVPAAPGPHPAILILHGSGGNSGYWLDRIAPFTRGLNLALFAVHYFDATGTSRAEPAQLNDGVHVPAWLQTVRDTIAHLRTLPAVHSERIALVGISLGGFLALALGTEPEQEIRTIVSISGGLAPPWDTLADAAFPPTLILHGDRDTVVPVSQAQAVDAILTRLGVRHELRILPGEGHFFSAGAQLQLLGEFARFLGANL